ncbi:alpha/beta hydrolase [Enterococcus timonensis]|uniref:alpha/beta hydrolase n=1 Tax=Enterococcus timonensis TaxID=1852364 RepID=UPI0008DB3098|nr:alpha/beta hydrolase [Enterococcus timonensis]
MIYKKITLPKSSGQLTFYGLDNSAEIDNQRIRPLIIICPGGGYAYLSDREAEPVAIKMLSLGFQTAVLQYSIKPEIFPTSLRQLAEAVMFLREKGSAWHIDSQKIVVAGFSAGGHLAASLGVFWQEKILADMGEAKLMRPDGLLLAYPVITAHEFAHRESIENVSGKSLESAENQFSLEDFVTSSTPKSFIWHTIEDDLVPPENSLLFAQALQKVKVPYELHLFPRGGHGLSLASQETQINGGYGLVDEVSIWPELFARWVENNL